LKGGKDYAFNHLSSWAGRSYFHYIEIYRFGIERSPCIDCHNKVNSPAKWEMLLCGIFISLARTPVTSVVGWIAQQYSVKVMI